MGPLRRWVTPRLVLRRTEDNVAYLTRWGIRTRWGNVYLHRFEGADPGADLHDHPWSFTSIILRGGYKEQRTECAHACRKADDARWWAEQAGDVGVSNAVRGRYVTHHGRFRVNRMPLTECHTIVTVKPGSITLVFTSPVRRSWGFYTADGFVDHVEYDHPNRELVAEGSDVVGGHNRD